VIVVTDTSAVLNLCFLGQEALLAALFGRILAPPAVSAEFQRLVRTDARFTGLQLPVAVEIEAPARLLPSLAGAGRLHSGEIAALSLAVERSADAVLMDERAGRAAAAALGLRCAGVLGILVEGKSRGLIPAVAPLLDKLQHGAGFWISPALRRQVLSSAGE
jgi:uncharacterized protein